MAAFLALSACSFENVHDSTKEASDEAVDAAPFEQNGCPDHQQGSRNNEKNRKAGPLHEPPPEDHGNSLCRTGCPEELL
jgi:hypothetical protein